MRVGLPLVTVLAAGCGRIGFGEAEPVEYVPPDVNEVAASAYVAKVLADAPIAYFRLESATTAEDATPFARHAALDGEVSLAPGVVGSAVRFGGGVSSARPGGRLTPPRAFLFNDRAPFTYECWLRPDVIDSNWRQLTQSDNWDLSDRRQGYTVEYKGADIYLDRRRDDLDEWAGATGVLVADRWFHVVATYDGALAAIYIDGVLRQSKSSPLAIASAPNTESTLSDPLYTVTGVLDECAIYDVALSPAQIANHYDLVTNP